MSDNHFSPPSADITSDQDIVYAGFWRRVFASLVDTVIVLLVMMPLVTMFIDIESLESTTFDFSNPIGLLINLTPLLLTVFFWTMYKATPGKMALGCQVVNASNGEKLGIGRSIVRYIGYMISGLPLGLGFLWVVFNKRKRGWHDLIAGTVVIRKPD